jgi:hypothetical protein
LREGRVGGFGRVFGRFGQWILRVKINSKSKINGKGRINSKGDGQECPSHTIRVKGNFNDIPCLF